MQLITNIKKDQRIPGDSKRFGDDRVYKIIFYIAVTLAFLWVAVKFMQPFFGALLLGSVLTIIGLPMKSFFDRKGFSTSVSALIVSLILILIVVVPLSLFAIQVAKEGGEYLNHVAASNLAGITKDVNAANFVAQLVDNAQKLFPHQISDKIPWEKLTSYSEQILATVMGFTVGMITSLPDTLFKLGIALLTMFFLLRDGSALVRWFALRIPVEPQVFNRLKQTTYNVILAATTGSFWAALIQSTLMALIFFLLSIPAVTLAAGATFFLAWIPFLGAAPVWVLGLVYLGINGLWVKFAILCVAGLIISTADNLVRVCGIFGDDGLHPMISLLAIFGGINIFGFVGVIIGPAVVAAGIVFFDLFKKRTNALV